MVHSTMPGMKPCPEKMSKNNQPNLGGGESTDSSGDNTSLNELMEYDSGKTRNNASVSPGFRKTKLFLNF